MTPQELEDETIAKIEALHKRSLIARDTFDIAKLTANVLYEQEIHSIETERLRVLMQHTIEAINLKDGS